MHILVCFPCRSSNYFFFLSVLVLRPEEPESYRDLALALNARSQIAMKRCCGATSKLPASSSPSESSSKEHSAAEDKALVLESEQSRANPNSPLAVRRRAFETQSAVKKAILFFTCFLFGAA
jgi:hypothetical protein